MNRRNLLKFFAALPAAIVPGCFAPGLPASSFVQNNAQVHNEPVHDYGVDQEYQCWNREERERQHEMNDRFTEFVHRIKTKT